MSDLAAFEEKLFAPETGVYDPVGVHHEFNQGLHGRKTDFDNIVEGSEFYNEWIYAQSRYIGDIYPSRVLAKAVLIGVAGGTNRVARDVGTQLDVPYLETEKVKKGTVKLPEGSAEDFWIYNPTIGIIIEDVGTRGTTSATAVVSVHQNRNYNLQKIEVVHTLLRGVPEWLVSLHITYHAMVNRRLLNYTAEECQDHGYCSKGWELVPHGQ